MELLKFIKPYLKGHKIKIVIYLLAKIMHSVIVISLPYITGKFIDSLIYFKENNYKLILFFLLLVILDFFICYARDMLMNSTANSISFNVQSNVFQHVRKLPLKDINAENPAYLTSKINGGAFVIPSFVISTVATFILDILTLIIVIILLLKINLYIGICVLVLLSINILTSKNFKKPLNKSNYELEEMKSSFLGILNNQIINSKLIKVNSWFDEVGYELKSFFSKFYSIFMRNRNLNILFECIISLLQNISILTVLIFSGMSIINNTLSIGSFQVLYFYATFGYSCIHSIMNFTPQYQQTLSFYSRIKEVTDLAIEHNGTKKLSTINSLDVKKLSFSHDNNKILLKDICYSFKRNNLYLLKGKNGSGKSTFVDLILGLYLDFEGSILYNDSSITSLDMYALRKSLIYKVDQEPMLINATIKDNIVYGLESYNEEYFEELLELFNVFNTNIVIDNKSTNISGGQKQKISLIRTFLRAYNKENVLIILDEPSSALDIQSIEKLKKLLIDFKENNIILMISHDNTFDEISDFTLRFDVK